MKIDKAKKISKTGKYHETFNSLFSKLPDYLINNLTANQIASIIDLMRDQYIKGHDDGYNSY